jgi:hypothetical protein
VRLDFVPLLETQRDLYRIPRGPERFRAYLRELIDPGTEDLRLPLAAMNPMGADHVPAFLDALLAIDADLLAFQEVKAARFPDVEGDFRFGLCVADDVGGSWTNRWAGEYSCRFEADALADRGWVLGTLWTSDSPTGHAVREECVRPCIGWRTRSATGQPTRSGSG